MIKITIICSDKTHPIFKVLQNWMRKVSGTYDVNIVSKVAHVENEGDLLFLVSCSEVVKKKTINMFAKTFVLHASDLPKGRGWSPHIWSILNGSDEIVLSLLEAESGVDTGKIWQKLSIRLDGTELYNEINDKLFEAEIELIEWACKNYKSYEPVVQIGEPTYYPKRSPEDGRLSLDKSLEEQINLLRVSDPSRYPAFFYYKGKKFIVKIEKAPEE